MKIGIPKEIKILEGRVGLTPAACATLVDKGHEVFLQAGAGELSGYPDAEYQQLGVKIVASAEVLYGVAELIVKVKEPLAGDLACLRSDHLLFCYLHLAANAELARQLCDVGLTAVAFETVTDAQGRLPLLAPMSEIAGKLSIQIGTHLLHQPQGGRGVLLGGAGLSEPGRVVVLGAGHAGGAAVKLASCSGAEVIVFERNPQRLLEMARLADNITALNPDEYSVSDYLPQTDLLVGAVLLPGLHAPRIVSEDEVKTMPSGSVIVDISVDQGGCIETIRATDYKHPTYRLHDVLHFGVTNMPGAVPRTASQALTAAILPYIERLTVAGWDQQADLRDGINIRAGKIDNPLIQQALQ
ncbi:MAG: alanine dehydrogenase [Gammaproteobacteria bacterium]|nr:alanine dehydrogenase [Gammaproteobacteria bacterium]